MTANKDFKRLVRARATRTGESYAEALRQLRARYAGRAAGPKETFMPITRAIPDIRCDDLEATKAFYAGLVGFDIAMEQDRFLLFTSPSDPKVQVSVNGDRSALPPGFIVDVGTAERVSDIHREATRQGLRIVEELDDKPWGIRRFSLLDPDGARVTVLAHTGPG
jgi:catechol 2,3-dioxygenase-like lactoylglutathione lyase family enzyme